jgi:hypothetical protein
MTLPLYDETDVRKALIKACESAGGTEAFAQLHQLDPIAISISCNGGGFSNRLLEILDFDRVSRFVRRAGVAGRRARSPHQSRDGEK